MPVTIVNAVDDRPSTLWTQQRRDFRNPRGLKYYYALITTSTGIQLYKSPDGVTWSLVSTLNTDRLFCGSMDIYDDGTQLIVYLTYGVYYTSLTKIIAYRRLRIPDDQSDPIIGNEQTVLSANTNGIPTIKRDRNGYVHIVYLKQRLYKIKGIDYRYGEPFIMGTTTINPNDTPNWSTPVQIASHPNIAEYSAYCAPILLVFGIGGDTGGVIFGNRTSTGTPIIQGRNIISFDGTSYTLGTITTIDSTLRAGTMLRASFGAVVDENNYSHLIFDSVTANQAIKSRKASVSHSVESWLDSVVVNTTGGGGTNDMVTLSIDTNISPNKLYGLYTISSTLRYRSSPVDVISWSGETSVADDTINIDQINASEKQFVGSIHITYRRAANPYAVRYYELSLAPPPPVTFGGSLNPQFAAKIIFGL